MEKILDCCLLGGIPSQHHHQRSTILYYGGERVRDLVRKDCALIGNPKVVSVVFAFLTYRFRYGSISFRNQSRFDCLISRQMLNGAFGAQI